MRFAADITPCPNHIDHKIELDFQSFAWPNHTHKMEKVFPQYNQSGANL